LLHKLRQNLTIFNHYFQDSCSFFNRSGSQHRPTEQLPQITEVDKNIKRLVTDIENISLTEFIDSVVRIRYRMTIIHPFLDGNGRVSRAFLNWMFRLKGLPPVYLKQENKQKYLDALSKADMLGDYDPLIEIFYREILRSMYELNSKFI